MFSVGTAPIFSTLSVDPVLDALLLAAQDVEVQRLLGLHAARSGRPSSASSSGPLDSKWAMKRSQRVLAAVEHEVVGEFTLVGRGSPRTA